MLAVGVDLALRPSHPIQAPRGFSRVGQPPIGNTLGRFTDEEEEDDDVSGSDVP